MNTRNVRCPRCGAMNRGLFLKETDGWMECIRCGSLHREVSNERKPQGMPQQPVPLPTIA